jgi:hypothetical protein
MARSAAALALLALLSVAALVQGSTPEGEAFLAANGAKEGVVTLPSGLQYKARGARGVAAREGRCAHSCAQLPALRARRGLLAARAAATAARGRTVRRAVRRVHGKRGALAASVGLALR